MKNKGMHLVWIVVDDFEKALAFYCDVLGMRVAERSKEWDWAELHGEDGSILGLGGCCPNSPIKAGGNAVPTFTVDNLDAALLELQAKKIQLEGPVQEVPGHVKMQLLRDPSGNYIQLVQKLEALQKAHTCGSCSH